MVRRGRFNKNQPRDRNGRWTGKGGGGGSRVRRVNSRPKQAQQSPLNQKNLLIGNAISAGFFATSGQPINAGIAAVGAGTAAYRLASTRLATRVNRPGVSQARRDTFNRRKAKADRIVGRIEKAQKVATVGAFVGGYALQGAKIFAAGKFAENARLSKGPLQLARTALKAKRPGRGGVYNITTMSGRKVK